MPEPSLAGHHALVTGAISPLGRALAVALAEAGATVSVTTLHDDRAEEVRANSILNECWSAGSQGQAHTLDLADPTAVEAAVDTLDRAIGPLDILVNCDPPLDVSLEDGQRAIEHNTTTMSVAIQAVAPRMAARGSGRVVNVVSPATGPDGTAQTLFAVSQAAVFAFTEALAAEWAAHASTHALAATVLAVRGHEEGTPDAPPLADAPRDLAGALLYLVTADAPSVNGELLIIDAAIARSA